MRNRMNRLLCVACVGGLVGIASADIRQESDKLLASDGGDQDKFGIAVAIDGPTVVVGAIADDDNGTDAGAAYLFDASTGSQLFKLLADDGISGDQFGMAVAIDGDSIIIGAPFDNDNGSDSGAAYLFDASTGMQLMKLLPDDGSTLDEFGGSVAISGTRAIVGARLDDVNASNTGAAYVFDTTTGDQLHKLFASDRASFDQFGWSVGLSGTTAVIGSPFDDDDGSESGAAYLFDVSTGAELMKITADDAGADQRFGIAVAIDGARVIVGAHKEAVAIPGAAYIFDASTGAQLHKLFRDDGEANDGYGAAVAISGSTAIVGARDDDENGNSSGSAYLFNALTGEQTFMVLPTDGEIFDNFGSSVAIDGMTACVGAFGDDDLANGSGAAYLFFTGAVTCPTDINRDGVVDTADLGILIGDFGDTCP